MSDEQKEQQEGPLVACPPREAVREGDTVLVTGATGYVAGFLVKHLLERRFSVRGTVRRLEGGEQRRAHLVSLAEELNAADRLEFVEADLTKDDGWDRAVAGCAGVFHTASPFPIAQPDDEMELIRPAVEGSRRVLAACARAGVRRVVLTSSVASIAYGNGPDAGTQAAPFTERDWSQTDGEIAAYAKSKTLAERAAWDLVRELPEAERFELATVNPSYVQGPVLSGNAASSLELVGRLLRRDDPGVADLRFSIVDVREVAAGHVAAMVVPEAAGHRHILHAGVSSMPHIAEVLAKRYNGEGFRVPTTRLPYALMWLLGRCDKKIRSMLPEIGHERHFDHSRAERVLGLEFRPVDETMLDMAASMIERGLVSAKK